MSGTAQDCNTPLPHDSQIALLTHTTAKTSPKLPKSPPNNNSPMAHFDEMLDEIRLEKEQDAQLISFPASPNGIWESYPPTPSIEQKKLGVEEREKVPLHSETPVNPTKLAEVSTTTAKAAAKAPKSSPTAKDPIPKIQSPKSSRGKMSNIYSRGFGALDLPLVDQFPCFQSSADGSSIESVKNDIKSLRNPIIVALPWNACPNFSALREAKELNSPAKKAGDYITDSFTKENDSKRASSVAADDVQKRGDEDSSGMIGMIGMTDRTGGRSTVPDRENQPSSAPKRTSILLEKAVISKNGKPATKIPPNQVALPQEKNEILSQPMETTQQQTSVKDYETLPYQGGPPPLVLADKLQQRQLHVMRTSRFITVSANTHDQVTSPTSPSVPRAENSSKISVVPTSSSMPLVPSAHQVDASLMEIQQLKDKPSIESINTRLSRNIRSFVDQPQPCSCIPLRTAEKSIALVQQSVITPTSIVSAGMSFQFQEPFSKKGNNRTTTAARNLKTSTTQIGVSEAVPFTEVQLNEKRVTGNIGSSCVPSNKRTAPFVTSPRHEKRTCNRQTAPLIVDQVPDQIANILTSATPSPSPSVGSTRSHQIQYIGPVQSRALHVREENDSLPKRFLCTDCPAAFAFKENCDRHVKVIHKGRSVYYCYHCDASYLQAKTLRIHVDKKHAVRSGDARNIPCYWCNFKASSDLEWGAHVLKEHPSHKRSIRGK